MSRPLSEQTDAERLARIDAIELDGERWWQMRDVCWALRVPKGRMRVYIPGEHRRRKHIYRPGYQSVIVTLIDREAVRILATGYCRSPLHSVMEALG